MRKLSVILSVIFSMFIGLSFAIAKLDSSYSVDGDNPDYTVSNSHYASDDSKSNTEDKTVITRTVIPAVPKTGPSINIIGIILATLAIFGGYIYIKKRADI